MQAEKLEGNYGKSLEIDLCHRCKGVWFDDKESIQLSPQAILDLIRLIHQSATPASPLAEVLDCPRCGERLTPTVDAQRNTRFTYLRCPSGDGHFITFFQFLREKNIVRSLDVRQINALKQRVKVIRCSNCGAPVNLEQESTCSFCHSPLSMLDPTQIQATLKQLEGQAERRAKVDPQVASKLIIDQLKVERFYADLHRDGLAGQPEARDAGLIETGLSVLMDLLHSV
jgi:hypothetical protein